MPKLDSKTNGFVSAVYLEVFTKSSAFRKSIIQFFFFIFWFNEKQIIDNRFCGEQIIRLQWIMFRDGGGVLQNNSEQPGFPDLSTYLFPTCAPL